MRCDLSLWLTLLMHNDGGVVEKMDEVKPSKSVSYLGHKS